MAQQRAVVVELSLHPAELAGKVEFVVAIVYRHSSKAVCNNKLMFIPSLCHWQTSEYGQIKKLLADEATYRQLLHTRSAYAVVLVVSCLLRLIFK